MKSVYWIGHAVSFSTKDVECPIEGVKVTLS